MADNVVPVYELAPIKRELIERKAVEGIKSMFPLVTNKYQVSVNNVKVKPKDYTLNDAKNAIIEGKSLTYPVTGDVTLKDMNGKVIDTQKNFRLLNLPHFTDIHTFVVDGNSYSVSNQLRTKPGVYTRVRKNEVPEVAFNLEKGSNFKVVMDPESSVFKLEHGSTAIPLYPVLKALGVEDKHLQEHWGPQIFKENADVTRNTHQSAITKAYERLVPKKEQSDMHSEQEKINKLRSYFDTTKVDPFTTGITLGKPYTKISGETIANASGKLLKVFNSEVEHDDRDSLEFQKLHSVDDFIKERIQKGGGELVKKIKFRADLKKDVKQVKDVIPVSTFTPTVKSLITQFNLSRTPDQINPVEIIDAAMKVTRLGEGGIESLRAVPEATRDLHATHLGVLDPVRTPESSTIGVDVRGAWKLAKDDHGNIYTQLQNGKTGKLEYVNVQNLRGKSLAFPTSQKKDGKLEVIKDSKLELASPNKVDYHVPNSSVMFSPASSLVPMIEHMHGIRAMMASKHITQAVPLKDREAPFLQPVSGIAGFETMHEAVGAQIAKRSPVNGVVTQIKDGRIIVKDKSGKSHVMHYADNFPLNSKTYLHEDILVKKGDRVKEGQLLTESNFTKNGVLALGRNAYVAYMPYHGENSNDAVVISESASKKFTSQHMYKKVLDVTPEMTLNKKYWVTQFPNKYTLDQFNKLDDQGIVKKGAVINYNEPVMLVLEKAGSTATDTMLGRLHKNLTKKYRDASVLWDHQHPGTVIDVGHFGNRIAVTVQMDAPMVVGDKLSGTAGNKGIVSRVIPDNQMPHDANGKPFDILLTPVGVVSRVNPVQVMEVCMGKIANKVGVKNAVAAMKNYSGADRVAAVNKELAKHKLTDKETVVDPITGRKIPNILTGYLYTHKLFKSTETNFGARGIGSYDINEQPTRGGEEGAKRLGGMEVNALLAHGATDYVREAFMLKSQKNTDWWNAFKSGMPLPPMKKSFIVDKMNGMLTGAGINVTQKNNKVFLSPLTDAHIKELSHGTLTEPDVLRKKDIKPEIGGLFDPLKTGGLEGEKWSDIKLAEPIVKPLFTKPAASILDISEASLKKLMFEKGGKHIQNLLAAVNLKKLKADTQKSIETLSGQKLDNAVKRMKYIEGLEKSNLSPAEAYTGQHVAVVPPKMRPVVPGPNGQIIVADANHLYRDTLLANKKFVEMKAAGLTHEADLAPMRKDIFDSVAAVAGISDPISLKLKQQDKKGFIKQIAGPRPADGMFQDKVYGRPQDLSGRGTIAPDPTLKMNEIGLPEDTAWGMYKPFIVKRLVNMGYKSLDAAEQVEKKTDAAKKALEVEVKERPILFNRAPSLWRYSMLAGYPKLIPGKTIRINPFVELPLNADYDGDTVQLHVPAQQKAIEDAKKLTLDKLLFSEKTRTDLLAKPDMEAIVGLYEATKKPSTGKKFSFKNKEQALEAYYAGKLKPNDEVVIG